MKKLLVVLFFSGLCFGQSTGFVNGKFQINNADLLVRGATNFTASGSVARDYIGDLNHSITAKWGSGLSLGVYRAPSAIFIQDVTGNVFAPGMVSTGALFVSTPTTYDLGKPHFQVYSGQEGAVSFTVDGNGHASLLGGCPLCASLDVNGTVSASDMVAASLDLSNPSIGTGKQGVYFQDGTNQNTAAPPPPLKATVNLVNGTFLAAGACSTVSVAVAGATTSMAVIAS